MTRSQIPALKKIAGSSCRGSVETNLMNIHDMLESCIAVAVAVAGSFSSNSSPSLETSIRCRCVLKRKKKKMQGQAYNVITCYRVIRAYIGETG